LACVAAGDYKICSGTNRLHDPNSCPLSGRALEGSNTNATDEDRPDRLGSDWRDRR